MILSHFVIAFFGSINLKKNPCISMSYLDSNNAVVLNIFVFKFAIKSSIYDRSYFSVFSY